MTACARCAALLVACCVVGAGSQAPPRPILAVSVSRSGGGTLCDLACRQFHGGPDMDCRLEGGAFHYLKALNGSVADHNLTFAATARAMAADAALCNAVVVEPGRRLGAGARAVLDAAAAAPAGASLWTAYAWLLLVRDPIKRFVSYAAKTRGLDRRRGVSIDARPDMPPPFSQASTRPARGRARLRAPESAGRGRAPPDADTEASAAAALRAAAAVDAVEDEARRRADALWVAFKRVVAASKGSCVNVWDGPASRLRFAQVPKASSTATMAVLAAAEAPGVLAYVSAADPAGPDAGRRLCYTCPYRAAPPWPPGRPKVAITFAWTREPTFRFISGYYTETSIGHLAHLPHFAVATEPAPARTSNLRAPVLKSVGQNCGHRFDYVWPLEDGTAPLWRLLEARVGLAGLAAAAEAAGFHHKHDAGAIVGARTAAALADQDENTQRRFRYSQRAYDAANAAKRVAFESFGAITPATLPDSVQATLCELLAVDYAALGYAWPPACAAYAATVAARDEAGRVGKLQGEVAELRDEVARLTKLLAEKAVDAPKPSGPPTKPKPRRCKGKVCF
ncbi:hypothetical protein SO694_00002268 [Aureococcus anophagefferens]|uniref:Sulfotransferase domain-containing protein n=1 Tax=Aureococcus anophagefferens TaxID=44056 RepID=A0ABR1GCP4_AURAN